MPVEFTTEKTKHTNYHSLKNKLMQELRIDQTITNQTELSTLLSVGLASLITKKF